MADIQFIVPVVLTKQTVKQFLDTMSQIFQMKGTETKNVEVVARNIRKNDIVGILLFYKIIEFSMKMHCFNKPTLLTDTKFVIELQKNGFRELVFSYVDDKPVDFTSLKYQYYEGVFIAPIKLNHMTLADARNNYIPKISEFYGDTSEGAVVLNCLGEIVSNFREHSQDDTDSVLVATGDADTFEIVCADTGIGLVSSLGNFLQKEFLKPFRNFDVLEKATERGVTSKHDTNHMGFGLWLIKEYVEKLKGDLHLYSEGAYYVNQSGKIKKGTCGFWKGTIIYVFLPLNHMSMLQTWQNKLAMEYEDIKINIE